MTADDPAAGPADDEDEEMVVEDDGEESTQEVDHQDTDQTPEAEGGAASG